MWWLKALARKLRNLLLLYAAAWVAIRALKYLLLGYLFRLFAGE
jgi:hypothetical protein